MSYTQLIPFRDGIPYHGPEFRNAWGGAARIWNSLWEDWVPKQTPYDSWLSGIESRRLWDLAKDKEIPLSDRAVHAFTFDRFYVAQKNFSRFAADLRNFVDSYPATGRADHLLAWADWLDKNGDFEAVGLYGTSVGENPWFRIKEGDDEEDDNVYEPVPLKEGKEVYEWLESLSS